MSVSNPENPLIERGKNDKLRAIRIPELQYTPLGLIILHRLIHDRDLKILITSRGNTTGTGKTTLAIILARIITLWANDLFDRQTEWTAEEYSFIDVWEYLEKYQHSKEGDVLISDEIEFMADKRRSMGNQNVFFSQAWQMLRYRNVITIGTAPGLHTVDKRVPQNTDIWINVTEQGRANVYYLTVQDFDETRIFKRLRQYGFKQTLLWLPLPDTDSDYQYLKNLKREQGVPGMNPENRIDQSDLKQAKSDTKRDIAVKLLKVKQNGTIQLSQADIGDIVGYSQQNIAKIKREELS